jgi:hypothetical protein
MCDGMRTNKIRKCIDALFINGLIRVKPMSKKPSLYHIVNEKFSEFDKLDFNELSKVKRIREEKSQNKKDVKEILKYLLPEYNKDIVNI